jgi:hypothetical protein
MEGCWARRTEVAAAAPLVPEPQRVFFAAEASSIRWFYHTIRTTANFYASCRLRDQLLGMGPGPWPNRALAEGLLAEWRAVLLDEQANVAAALPVAQADVRLDFYYGSDHTFPHLGEMLAAKRGRCSRSWASAAIAGARLG